MADVMEIDALTGQVIERDFTEEEKAQRDKDAKEAEKAAKGLAKEEKAKAAAKESALAKLAALGLTEEEAKAIFGGNA